MNGLDLFSGIGGLAFALAPWVTPVAYCEIEPYARAVLLSRMADGGLRTAPIWDDVRTLRGSSLPPVDIITGGFPCQDVSQAGARKGLDGERTGLYREVLRLVDECEPAFVFLENVRGIATHVPRIIRDFAERGFVLRVGALAAADVGAPHIRDRAWFFGAHTNRLNIRIEPRGGAAGRVGPLRLSLRSLASTGQLLEYPNRERQLQQEGVKQDKRRRTGDAGGSVADASCGGRSIAREKQHEAGWSGPFDDSWWTTEPNVGRVAHGVPKRVDRLRGLGNAVVPAQAREAFQILAGIGGAS